MSLSKEDPTPMRHTGVQERSMRWGQARSSERIMKRAHTEGLGGNRERTAVDGKSTMRVEVHWVLGRIGPRMLLSVQVRTSNSNRCTPFHFCVERPRKSP